MLTKIGVCRFLFHSIFWTHVVSFHLTFEADRPGVIVSFREVWYTSGQASHGKLILAFLVNTQWKTRLSFSITYAITLPLNLWNKSPPRWMESLCLWRPDAFGNCSPLEIPDALRLHALLPNLDFSWKESDTTGNSWEKYWDLELWNQKKAKHRVWSRFPFFWKLWISCLVFQTFTQPSTRKRWDGFKPSGSCSPTTRKESWLFQPNRWKRASGIPHQQFGSTVVTWLSGQKGLVWPNSWEHTLFFLGA